MLMDCHTHLWLPEHWSEEMIREARLARMAPAQISVTPESHWEAMREVDRAIVLAVHSRHLGIIVPNDFVAAYVREHPDKLIGFACVDPNEPGYLEEMRRAFEDLGLRGLKLAPIYQNYHPQDPRMTPVYEYCEKRGLPVLFHQGTTFARRAPLKFASPVQLEDVALSFPGLAMVIAHMGHPWIEETVVLIRKQPHVYADISALYYRPWQFYNALVLAQEYGCAHKLLFGTDYPFTTPGDTVRALQNVNAVTVNTGLPRIADATIEGILERDAAALLGLS